MMKKTDKINIKSISTIGKNFIIDSSGCWLWQGHIHRGYGYWYTKIDGKGYSLRVHRLIYSLIYGEIPDKMVIDHLCQVRNCVNPKHMEVVEHRENTLRGTGLAAINAKKTHCAHGHPYTPDNTRYSRGSRHCRVCDKIKNDKRREDRLAGL